MRISLKEILLPEEIQQLVATHFEGERTEIHRAFIFGLYTGVRWCDTSQMTYRNIDYSTKTLRFQQQKTKDHSSRSWVIVPLNDTLIRLIGEPDDDNYDGRVFKLPHYNICNLYLRDWVKGTGIKKKTHMALRAAQFRGERTHQRCQYQNRVEPFGPYLHKDDRK